MKTENSGVRALGADRRRVVVFALIALAGLASSAAYGENRHYDGHDNNVVNPNWGTAHGQLLRMSGAAYSDGLNGPSRTGVGHQSARAISNAVVAQPGSIPNNRGMSDWVWQWGQFLDHDFSLTEPGTLVEPFDIQVPAGDPWFDPMNTGTATIGFSRAEYMAGTGVSGPREHANQLTSYLDGSMVYGSDAGRAGWLRDPNGGGKLKVTPHWSGDMMPYNDGTVPNAMGMSTSHFVAGDVRANEQIGLTSVHTLFLREHNRLAGQIALANPDWDDEQIYQRARKIVGAEIQAITFNEWIPALFGEGAVAPYAGYDPSVDASIATEFSTAAFRIGHTMLNSQLQRIDNSGTPIPEGPANLRDSFFNPAIVTDGGGIGPILKGLASQAAQEIDVHIVDDVRNFLFGPPGAGGFDLASLNIQRGRDLGLADYNTIRQAYGLTAAQSFSDVTSDIELQAALASVYADVDSIDPWIGMLAEDHVAGGSVGELMRAVILDQFSRARSGDRFWYEADPEMIGELGWINDLRLSDIIRWNTEITNIQGNVFFIPAPGAGALLALGLAAGARRRRG